MEPTLWEFFRNMLSTCGKSLESVREASVDKYVLEYAKQSVMCSDATSGIRELLAVLYTPTSFDVVAHVRLWRPLLTNFPDKQPSLYLQIST